ncbi:MAG: hypothetical protein JXM79_05405 [Sedimentisphaerales bacterium]|nr:hypothetical protein [Sedimentisphaerales bacterium]
MRLSCKILFVSIVSFLSTAFSHVPTAVAQASPVDKLVAVSPDDVLCLFATSGGDTIKPEFDKSIIGRFFRDPAIQPFVEFVKQWLQPEIKREMSDAVWNFVNLVSTRPVIAGVAQKNSLVDVPFYGFAIVDAGPRKSEIASALDRVEALATEEDIVSFKIESLPVRGFKVSDDVLLYWGWAGDILFFSINDDVGFSLKHLQGNNRRSTPAYLRNLPGSCDVFAAHIDIRKILSLVETVVRNEGAETEFAPFKTFIETLGLDNLKTFTFRTGFDRSDLVFDSLLESPPPRKGMQANFRTIDIEFFDMVDPCAMTVTALGCDIAGVYDRVMKAIESAMGDDFARVEEKIADIEAEAKIKIRDGLLESLDDEVLLYGLGPAIRAQCPQGGTVAIAKLKDAQLWESTLTALGEFLAEKSEGVVQIGSQNHGNNTFHIWVIAPLAMTNVIPSWTVTDGKFIFALNPPLLRHSIEMMNSDNPSIRTTAGFKNISATLPDNLVSLKYTNSKAQFDQMMIGIQQYWPLVAMTAKKQGWTIPPMPLNLSHISKDMGYSYGYSWFDTKGLHSHYRGNFIGPDLEGIAVGALGMGILMPALARVRQLAFRMTSATNLSGIGQAIRFYSEQHNNKFPSNLQELVEKAKLSPKALESKMKPEDFQGPSYIYIAGQDLSMYPGNFVAFENPSFCTEGVNVLHLDGHVEWMKPDMFMQELEATYQRLGRPTPDIQFKSP